MRGAPKNWTFCPMASVLESLLEVAASSPLFGGSASRQLLPNANAYSEYQHDWILQDDRFE